MPNFAKNLMMHLFDLAELKRCLNVHGRSSNPNKVFGPRLDEKRINVIRQIVEENSTFSPTQLWKNCVNSMNRKISDIKSNDRSQTTAGQK